VTLFCTSSYIIKRKEKKRNINNGLTVLSSHNITNLRKRDVFFRHEWLQQHNLSINWQSSKLYLDKYRHWYRRVFIEEEPEDIGEKANEIEEGGRILFINIEEKVLR